MVLDFAAVDWSDPILGYLPDPETAVLADVRIKHSGLALPAHSFVLAQAGVLKQLLLSMADPAGGAAARQFGLLLRR